MAVLGRPMYNDYTAFEMVRQKAAYTVITGFD